MVYELSVEDLLDCANAIPKQIDAYGNPVECEAKAHYYRVCAIAKKYGISEDNELINSAEQMYADAIRKNKMIDWTSQGQRVSRILKAVSKLEQALIENVSRSQSCCSAADF